MRRPRQSTVCKDSTDANGKSLLAGEYCPESSVEEKVFIRRPVPYVPVKPGEKAPADLIYELPEGEYCNVHVRRSAGFGDIVDDIPDIPMRILPTEIHGSTFSMNLTRHSANIQAG